MRSCRCLVTLAVVTLALGGAAAKPPPNPPPPPPPPRCAASTPAQLKGCLQAIVDWGTTQFNNSGTFSVVFDDGTDVSVAAGVDDRQRGTPVTTMSQFPAGSLTKPTIAVGLLQLMEQGKLDLDAAFASIVDPWRTRQGLPTLGSIWGSPDGGIIETVTVRQLLTMTAGLRDYDDNKLEQYAMQHASEDVVPEQYLSNTWLNKSFIFPPGGCNPLHCNESTGDGFGHQCDPSRPNSCCVPNATGVAYSSDGFVLAGMVLAALTNASSWDNLDQHKAIRVDSAPGAAQFTGAIPPLSYILK